ITCGVSGAIQFVAGMNGAEKIIAINTDPEAPIFNIAHIGIIGDLYKIVPELIASIKQSRKED
ncbi:MAG: electron transfer flavoprotein subunit alpha/FixB family protein, partial [Victivallales bacterium]|nr:electron transfer flavoprotein subunit alpha/FixB family protein [Victivallales bacterium]